MYKVLRGLFFLLFLSVLAFLYIGLQGSVLATPLVQVRAAQAILTDPTGESPLSGQVTMVETPDGLQIEVAIADAPPGYHGLHIHALNSCADNGSAAGGHFNPDNVRHGKLIIDGFENAHAGDLGNILIRADGTGTLKQTVFGLLLTDGKYAVADHAMILHANRDNFSQPTGDAGGRIGCGVLALQS